MINYFFYFFIIFLSFNCSIVTSNKYAINSLKLKKTTNLQNMRFKKNYLKVKKKHTKLNLSKRQEQKMYYGVIKKFIQNGEILFVGCNDKNLVQRQKDIIIHYENFLNIEDYEKAYKAFLNGQEVVLGYYIPRVQKDKRKCNKAVNIIIFSIDEKIYDSDDWNYMVDCDKKITQNNKFNTNSNRFHESLNDKNSFYYEMFIKKSSSNLK